MSELNELREALSAAESQVETGLEENAKLRALTIHYRDQFRKLAKQLAGVPQ